MSTRDQPAAARLRAQAERAMHDGKPKAVVTPLLERVLDAAPEGSAAAVFAHRHLAEYRIEDHPWRALLHLRRIVLAGQADDGVHALAGLAHALLGNYLSAVAEYRRAVRLEPTNPWYRHNLGHLLDVALDRPKDALPHLEGAAHGAPTDVEIAASLAHCLARVGQKDRAASLAEDAVRAVPGSTDHEELLRWIRQGAERREGTGRPSATPDADLGASDAVTELLKGGMRDGGFSAPQIERALGLYAIYRSFPSRGRSKPGVVAAALEYATARLEKVAGVTRASVARRYGVTPRAVSERVDEIEGALALTLP